MEAPKAQIIQPAAVISLKDLAKDTSVSKIYANGLQCEFSLSDGTILFKLHESPVVAVSMSLPLMKSLFSQLGQLIAGYEKEINNIDSIEQLKTKLKIDQ